MIGVHLLSEQLVNWYRLHNEMIGVHLLSVGTRIVLVCMIGVYLLSVRTSSIGTHDWCTFTVHCPVKTSSVLPLVQMMVVKQLHYY